MTKEVGDSDFELEVLRSDKPVLVDFWAEWCGPCKMLGPIITALDADMGDKVKIFKMDVDKHQSVPSNLGIRSIPTMILFNKGSMVDMKVGVMQKDDIKKWIESSCGV